MQKESNEVIVIVIVIVVVIVIVIVVGVVGVGVVVFIHCIGGLYSHCMRIVFICCTGEGIV